MRIPRKKKKLYKKAILKKFGVKSRVVNKNINYDDWFILKENKNE